MHISPKIKLLSGLSFILLFVCFIFFFPRWLVSNLGEAHFLSSYLYIYVLGTPFFFLGLYLLVRSKALNLKLEGEKKWLWFFIAGLAWYIFAHGFWIFIAVKLPTIG